jgi:hypothetical protein
VLGGVRSRVVPRACDDGFEDDFDEDFAAARPDPPDLPELWARGFFEGPHVFIVEPHGTNAGRSHRCMPTRRPV